MVCNCGILGLGYGCWEPEIGRYTHDSNSILFPQRIEMESSMVRKIAKCVWRMCVQGGSEVQTLRVWMFNEQVSNFRMSPLQQEILDHRVGIFLPIMRNLMMPSNFSGDSKAGQVRLIIQSVLKSWEKEVPCDQAHSIRGISGFNSF